MSLDTVLLLVFGAVAVAVLTVLVLALARGRVRPQRTWAWITGLVIAIVGTCFHLMIAGLMVVAYTRETAQDTMPWWLLLGSTALVGATILAVVNPRWAAVVFAATAVVVPAAVAIVEAGIADPMGSEFPAAAILGFYSIRAVLTAAFLWISSLPVRGGRPPASPSPTPRSESVPIG